jgi:hypothetical protein
MLLLGCAEPGPVHEPIAESDEQGIIAALRQATNPLPPRTPPAPQGIQWADVPAAAASAADAAEMAIVEQVEEPWGLRFRLKTVEDRPAELLVYRTDDARVYDASATVGRFEDDIERAKGLIDAFHRFMREFGEKRSLPR